MRYCGSAVLQTRRLSAHDAAAQTRPRGSYEQLRFMSLRPGQGDTPAAPSQPPAAAPGAADAQCAGLAALSLHPPGPGGGGLATAAGAALSSRGAAGGAAVERVGDAINKPDQGEGAAAANGGVQAATRAASTPDAGPSVLFCVAAAPSGEAAASPFSPPATERHAAILKLVDTATKAAQNNRHSRAADFYGQAAEAAVAGVALFDDESVVVAKLRTQQALEHSNQSIEEVQTHGPSATAEAALQRRRAWVLLVAFALPVLQSRIDKGTLLPGKCRPVEEAYEVYEQQAINRLTGQLTPGMDDLRRWASVVGYDTALNAAWLALNLLSLQLGNADQRSRARAFVLAVVRLIPQTAALAWPPASESALVDMINHQLTPEDHGDDFCAAVLALWRSPAVAGVLRARGALQKGSAAKAAADAEFVARQAADLAKYGLQKCALPSCGRQEVTALQFRVCSACKATRYCGPEHQAAHAEAHRAQCRGRG